MTHVPKVALATLLRKRYRVRALLPIKPPSGNKVNWVVRWEDLPGSTNHRALPSEAEALRFRAHLAEELERRKAEQRARDKAQRRNSRKPSRSGGGGGPVLINRSEPVPGTDLTVKITTAWRDHRTVYTVAAVTDDGAPSDLPKTYDDPARARRAANKLYAQLTEENER